MQSRSDVVHHIAPDCSAELDQHIREEAAKRGERVMPAKPFPWNRPKHKPGGRVDLPGQLELDQTAPDTAGLAKLKAAAPMRPDKPQKPCDTGLFSDQTKQVDLEDLL